VISGGFAVVWGLNQLSKEEHLKTAEFLLTRPISRDQILSSKLIVLFSYIIGINVLGYLAGLVSCTLAAKDGFDIGTLTILHLYGLMACLFFGALGVFISVLIRRGKSMVGIGIGIVVGAYLLDMILKVYGKADFLLYLTPFKYIDLQISAINYHLQGWRILIPLGVTLILALMSYMLYRRKDIYT
jgi:ABC-2 type transport system permease protein